MTIGVGHNLDAKPLSERVVAMILEDDIDDAMREADERFPWLTELDPVRRAVVYDMTFNMGAAKVARFRGMIGAIKQRNWSLAAQHMLVSLWAKQVGQRAQHLAACMESGRNVYTVQV